MKVFFRNIHLYLSLAAGLVIISCCFTGSILVFEKELQEAFNHGRYFVKQEKKQLPLEHLINNIKQQYPTAEVASVRIYTDPKRSVEVGVSIPEKGKKDEGASKAKTEQSPGKENVAIAASKPAAGQKEKPATPAAGEVRQTYTAFVNPYTAQILDLYSYRETFFYTMFSLHRWLLGGSDSIGKTITGISTFIFLFILITGIILWWPRNKAILKQRLKIKTNASWKRVTHDLHLVLGFYSAIFLLIFAFTALAWSFKWFNNGIYKVTNSSMKPVEPPRSTYHAGDQRITYDSAFVVIQRAATNVQYYTLRVPNDSTGIFSATVLPKGVHESAADNYYIDQYSGQVIGALKFQEKNLGQRVRSTFKPVHIGSIFGLPSKIIAFLACIFGVTFPITGTIMWLNRLKKKKTSQKAGSMRRPVLVEDDDEF